MKLIWQRLAHAMLVIVLVCVGITVLGSAAPSVSDSAKSIEQVEPKGQLIVTYFHGNARCATCLKLEGYAAEVMDSAFGEALRDSSMIWQLINYDKSENEHYLKDYSLFTKSLILSYRVGGQEKGWKNLDKIWELVGDKTEYQEYVRNEIRAFLAEQAK